MIPSHILNRPTIVKFPRDHKLWRFGNTYSIFENGEFWKKTNGSRRAWSYYDTALEAMRGRH